MRKFLLICFMLIMLFSFVGCNEDNHQENQPNENQKEEQKKEENTELEIIKNSETSYEFLCAEKASTDVIFGMKSLIDKINQKTGMKIKGYRDTFTSEEGRCEVLIGLTNRSESIEAYEELKELSYSIKIVNNCLVIIGKDDVMTALALFEFENSIIKDDTKCNTGFLKFTKEDNKTIQRDTKVTLSDILDLGLTPTATVEQVFRKEPLDELYFITQSFCTDGKYFYIDMNPRTNGLNILFKYDLEFNLIATSEVIDLGHCNGMTFNTKTNEIVVADCEDKLKMIIVDPETLTIKRNVTITEGTGAVGVAYIPSLDLYACNCAKSEINFYDTDFHLVRTATRDASKLADYINQDAGCDGKYIYFEMPKTGYHNILDIYDLNGNYVTTMQLPITLEGESITYVNGEYYVLVYKSMDGLIVYKLNYSLRYE